MALATTPYISKSGQVAFFFALNSGARAYVTAVSSQPTISVNGSVIQIQGPIRQLVASIQFPWIAYQLSCGPVQSVVVQKGGSGYTTTTATVSGGGGGSGCVLGTPVVVAGAVTSIPVIASGSGYTSPITITISGPTGSGAVAVPIMAGVQPGDVVTYSAAAGWYTAGGAAPVASGASVANYSGTLEPGLGGAVDFDMPASQRTMKPGFVLSWPEIQPTMNAMANCNWLRRMDVMTNVVTKDAGGHPLTIQNTATGVFDDPGAVLGNLVDGKNYPNQTGVWTFIADDTAPGLGLAMMTVTLTGNARADIIPIVPAIPTGISGLVDAGTLAGGTQIGRVWQWNVKRFAGATIHNLTLTFNVKRTGATNPYRWTLTNEAMFSPLATVAASPGGGPPYPVRGDLMQPDQSIVNWCSTPQGKYPASLRYVELFSGYSGLSSVVDATDYHVPSDFSWANSSTNSGIPTFRRILAINTVRTYAITTSGWPVWTPTLPATGTVTWTSPNVYIAAWDTLGGNGVDSITITSGGSGYGAATTASISDPTGTGCVLGAVTRTGTSISAVAVTIGGGGYTSPTITFNNGGAGSGGAIASANLIQLDRGVDLVQVNVGGSGYTAPVATASGGGGSGCVLGTPVVSGGVIQSIPVVSPGSGYTTPPDITIADPNGTGAFAAARSAFQPPDQSWLASLGAPWYCGEFVTSAPHNLKTGQFLNMGGTGTFNVSNGSSAVVAVTNIPAKNAIYALCAWVTGPTTIAFLSDSGATTAAGMPGGINNVAGTFPVNLTATVAVPPVATMPFEASAKTTAMFPGCNHYLNIPHSVTGACSKAIARITRDILPPGCKVYLEHSLENWNFQNSIIYHNGMGRINAWGTRFFHNSLAYITRSWQHHNIWVDVFNEVGRGSEIQRLFGSQAAGAGVTTTLRNYVNNYNSGLPAVRMPIGCVSIASYVDSRTESQPNPAVRCTVDPIGGGTSGGTLAAGNYFVAVTWIETLTGLETSYRTLGPAASTSESIGFQVLTLGQIPRVTLPTRPAWAGSTNVYLTLPAGASGTEVLYATGITATTYDLTVANTGTIPPPVMSRLNSYGLAVQSLASNHVSSGAYLIATPFSRKGVIDLYRHQVKYGQQWNLWFGMDNQAVGILSTYNRQPGQPLDEPYIIGYEGGLQNIVPTYGNVAAESDGRWLYTKLTHDLIYDPDIRDAEMAHLQLIQQGQFRETHLYSMCQPIAVNGAGAAGFPVTWGVAQWPGQPAGRGDGSGTTTTSCLGPIGTPVQNQFWIDDGNAHFVDNASVRMQAVRDWWDGMVVAQPSPLRGTFTHRPIPAGKMWAMHG